MANATLNISSGVTSSGISLEYNVGTYQYLNVLNGGSAWDITVNTGGSMWVSSGGTAKQLVISSGGYLNLLSGAILSGGTAQYGGAVLNMLGSVTASEAVFAANSANNGGAIYNVGMYTINGGVFAGNSTTNHGGAILNDEIGTIIISNAVFTGNSAGIAGGAIANNTHATMTLIDASFTTANDTIGNYGNMSFAGTISLAGNLYSDQTITATGATVILDISSYAAANTVEIVTDITKISGASNYRINVAANQAGGSYKLATNAGAFTSITVTKDADLATSITMTVNGASTFIGNREYALVRGADNILYLSVTSFEDPSMVVTIADGNLIDVYDNEISLAEAMTVYANHGGTLGTVVSFANTATSIAFSSSIQQSIANMTLSGNGVANTVLTPLSGAQILVSSGNTLNINDLTMSGANGANSSGGAIFNVAGSVNISEATFAGNIATIGGGAIYNMGNATITEVNFSGNSADSHGGAIYNNSGGTLSINGGTFASNFASRGGAVLNIAGTLTVSGATFIGNSATSVGGAIYNSNVGTITDVVFSANSVYGNGGAILNSGGSSELTISGGIFVGNSAYNGGAIYNSATLVVSGGIFANNSATSAGGAIGNGYLLANAGPTTIIDTVFSGNWARSGGAIFNSRRVMTLSNTVFETTTDTIYNTGTMTFAGTISLAGNLYSTTAITATNATVIFDISSYAEANTLEIITDITKLGSGVNFAVNVATNQANDEYKLATNAASFAQNVSLTVNGVYISDFTVIGQTITTAGKEYTLLRQADNALYLSIADAVQETPSMIVTISNGDLVDAYDNEISLAEAMTVYANHGGTLGAVVGFANTVTSVAFSSSIVQEVTNLTMSGNGAANTIITPMSSAQILVNGGSTLNVTALTMSGARSSFSGGVIYNLGSVAVNNASFTGNSALLRGGAIYNGLGGVLNISSATFNNNSVLSNSGVYNSGLGGAIYNEAGGVMTGSNLVFSSNYGVSAGGLCNNGSATLVGVNFSRNNARSHGGAIYNNGVLEISDGVFSGNSAALYGGAIYASSGGTTTINGKTFIRNSSLRGGAIFNGHSANLNVSGVTFSGNLASHYGGAINNHAGATATITDGIFLYNSGGIQGGAIYNQDGFMTINSATFLANSCQAGGAVYNRGTIIASDMVLTSNKADFGGAFHNLSSGFLSNVTFNDNVVLASGGAVLNQGSYLTLKDNTFSNNRATSGGAICNEGSNINCSDTIFTSNSASVGGAICNTSNGTMSLTNVAFTTISDSIYNLGVMTLGGTISLAGNLYSVNAITATGATVIFDITTYAAGNTVEVITDITKVVGTSEYRVSVTDSHSVGLYKLATNAASFTDSISLYDKSTNTNIVMTVGDKYQKYSTTGLGYKLVVDANGVLSLSIAGQETPSMIVTISNGDLVDAYDQEISLREAMTVYASGGSLGNVVGFANTVTSVTFSGSIVPGASSMTLSGNGATNTVIAGVSGGQIVVSSWDKLYVEQATIVGGISLEGGGGVHVLNGGVVSNISLGESWAGVLISSGGSAVSTLITNSNASQRIASGGTALYATLSGGFEDVNGGHAISTVLFDSAVQEVYDGGLAEYTSINSGGAQYLVSSGIANYAVVNSGGVQEIGDATANNTTVNSGGVVVAYEDAIFGGNTYWAGAVYLYEAATATGTITFGVNQRTEADGVIIDNIANLTNNGTYAVSVTDSQDGKYALAGGAAAFNDSISLVVGGVDTGLVLTVGGPAQKYNDIEYAITVDGDILYLNIFTFNPIIVTILGDAHIDGENTYRECVEIYASQGYDEVNFKDTLNGGTVMITSGAVNAGAQTIIRGNGVTSTYVGGAATYGNGYGLEMNDLTYLNNLAGGAFNASIDGGASLTLDTVTVTNSGTAYATAGSVVSGRLKQYYIDGDVDFNIINTTFTSLSRTAGAGFVDTANLVVTGDVNIDVKDSKLVILYGGAWLVNGGLVRIEGDINITLDLGTQSGGAVYAGSYIPGSGISLIDGTTSMTIKSGNFTGVVGNGSYVTAGNEASQGDSVLTIEGGSFARAVYAGGYSNGGISVVNGNTYLNISGGTFATNVYGGSYGNNAANGDKTLINGSTNITIDCSASAISFGRYIQAGSAGNGVIIGDTNITFTGLGSNLTFAAGAAVSGESEVARTTNNYVSGDKYINFDNFTGDFNALLVGFTNFTIKGDSQVSYIGGVDSDKLSYVNSWGFALTDNNKADGALIWDGGINNFSGDSIELAFDSSLLSNGETAKIIDGNAASVITGWDAFGAVNFVIGGVNYAANWSAGDAGYLSSNGWLLSADESNFDLILTKIS